MRDSEGLCLETQSSPVHPRPLSYFTSRHTLLTVKGHYPPQQGCTCQNVLGSVAHPLGRSATLLNRVKLDPFKLGSSTGPWAQAALCSTEQSKQRYDRARSASVLYAPIRPGLPARSLSPGLGSKSMCACVVSSESLITTPSRVARCDDSDSDPSRLALMSGSMDIAPTIPTQYCPRRNARDDAKRGPDWRLWSLPSVKYITI